MRCIHVLTTLLVTGSLLSGCGLLLDLDPPDEPLDAAAPDGGPMDASTRDASTDGGVVDCADRGDGDPCGIGRYCVDGLCQRSVCGDSVVDPARGEQCDDGNMVDGDGCESDTCAFSCVDDGACVSNLPCVIGSCDLAAHRCQYVPFAGSCEFGYECRSGGCVAIGCGDGVLDGDEACDDGNLEDGDGCDSDCTVSCEDQSDCDDGDYCNGAEACVANRCVNGEDPCGPPMACYMRSCDALLGCLPRLIDADGDGFAPLSEGPCVGGAGGDCDDADPLVYPGAPEVNNGRDDDCDSSTDEDGVAQPCFEDLDGDGWGSDTPAAPSSSGSCPAGTSARRGDCYDDGEDPDAPNVNPDHRIYERVPYCDGAGSCSFDWDCDGVEEPREPVLGGACVGPILGECRGGGWQGEVPGCGETGAYRECRSLLGFVGCVGLNADKVQRCL